MAGGVDVGDVDAKAYKMEVPVFLTEQAPDVRQEIAAKLLFDLDDAKKALLTEFIQKLYSAYVSLYFTYLEINPLGKGPLEYTSEAMYNHDTFICVIFAYS